MFKKIINIYKGFEKITYKILKNGLMFCLFLSLISIFILLTYMFVFTSPFLYYIGLNLFKISLIFSIEFIICSFVIDGIKKELI